MPHKSFRHFAGRQGAMPFGSEIRCNAEPFMDGYYGMNLEDEFAGAGFERTGMFRLYAPSLIVQRGFNAQNTRTSGGRYFLAGARKQL